VVEDRRGREAKKVRRKKTILVALVMLAAVPAMALDKEDVSVEKEDRSDFTHPSRLSSAVTAREVLGQQDGVVRVRTEFRDCVLFFCKKMILIHDVTVSANEVRADVVPEGQTRFVPTSFRREAISGMASCVGRFMSSTVRLRTSISKP
jgi:hypothetical protein